MKINPGTAMLLFLIVAAFSLAALSTKRNEEQVTFLCRTSGALALVLDSAANQIQTNFTNGTYSRLLKQGIITQDNVNNAQQTLDQYRAEVALLRSPDSPCRGVK